MRFDLFYMDGIAPILPPGINPPSWVWALHALVVVVLVALAWR